MTLQPLVFSVFGFEITGYGIMLMVAFLTAGWTMQRELQRRVLDPDYASDIVVAALVGGIVGAKLWYFGLTGDPRTLISRGGMVWYGGFLGGTVAVLGLGWWKRIPMRFTLELSAPALAVGYALGRVGCFLVEDDYGIPTKLPWAVKFPNGLPATTAQNLAHFNVPIPAGTPPYEVLAVHPTELYEVAAMLIVFGFLWRIRSHRHAVGWLFGLYLTLAGLERFLIEFIRAKDDRVLHGFTIAQAASVVVLAFGLALLARWWREDGFNVSRDVPLQPPSSAPPAAAT